MESDSFNATTWVVNSEKGPMKFQYVLNKIRFNSKLGCIIFFDP